MEIKKITLKNYKFHHNLDFNIKQKNCLIYGENGTGKSSIYKALYSNFYYLKDNKISTNQIDVRKKFIHRDYENENLEANIVLDNGNLNRINNKLTNFEILKNQTIYLADEKVFHKITQKDFFEVINSELIKHFPQFKELNKLHRNIKTRVTRSNINEQEEIVRERQEADILFEEKFKELVPIDEINIIIKKLKEDFKINFDIEKSIIKFRKQEFIPPKISIKVKGIDDKGDFKNHFNEAKLKLISIAIYFALAKKYEIKDSNLKLLVLDDFLTSLDMANRKLIMWYILDNFADYQKIIMTHNIQFYNVIVKILNFKNKKEKEKEKWDFKIIYLDNHNIAYIRDKEEDYLKEAKRYLDNGDTQISGNFLRKEFEKIISEFKQILELGKNEELKNIIDSFVNSKNNLFYERPNKLLNDINNILKNENTTASEKLKQLKNKLESSKNLSIRKQEELKFEDMKNVLKRARFYHSILMNPASHNDTNTEIYHKECRNSIKLLKELNKILDTLK